MQPAERLYYIDFRISNKTTHPLVTSLDLAAHYWAHITVISAGHKGPSSWFHPIPFFADGNYQHTTFQQAEIHKTTW
jgi:hypothetical protein